MATTPCGSKRDFLAAGFGSSLILCKGNPGVPHDHRSWPGAALDPEPPSLHLLTGEVTE
jgi:hypothetical protein